MPVGPFNTNQFAQDQAKKSFSALITRIMPSGGAPIVAMTSELAEETAAAIEHGFFSKTMIFPSVQLAANITAADSVIPVVSSANILEGQILQVDSTGENMLVRSINGNQVVVQRGFGGVAAQAASSGVNAWMVGNAYEEGSVRPAALMITANRITNFTQIFRNSWAVPRTAAATGVIAGQSAVAENRNDCATFHAVDMEKGIIWGQKYFGMLKGQPIHTMDGLIALIRANAPANINTLGSTTNYTQLEAALDPAFNQTTDMKSAPQRAWFVGGTAKRVIHGIARVNSTYQVINGKEANSWGMQWENLVIPRGTFRMIEHPLFNAYGPNSTLARMGIAVDIPTFNLAYLRKTVSEEYGANVDNGIDAQGGTLTTELTTVCRNPAANVVLYNFTAAAVG